MADRSRQSVSSMLESLLLTQEGSLTASSFRAVMRQVRWCEAPLAAGLLYCIQSADVDGLLLNNIQDAKSCSVFRKARSEALAANDLDNDPLIDLMKMAMLQAGDQDQILDNVLPASEFISNSHTSASIGFWLLHYKQFLINNNQWPICSRVVTDFSWAIINAVLIQWNCMSMVPYLLVCHEIVNIVKDIHLALFTVIPSKKKHIKELVMQVMCSIINCSSYKIIKSTIKHVLIVLLSKNMTLEVRKSLVGLSKVCDPLPSVGDNDFEETDDADINESTSDAIYQQSPFYKDMKAIETEVHTLLNIKELPKEDEPKVFENLDSSDSNKNMNSDDSTTHDSASRTENIYYNSKMANLIINKYSPYLPLWSGLLLHTSTENVCSERMSNGPVENWFFQLKHIILAGNKRLRPNRFIRMVREYVMSIYKETIMDIPKEGCARGKRKHNSDKRDPELKKKQKLKSESALISGTNSNVIDCPENMDIVEETWQRRERRPKTFFNSQYIQRIYQQEVVMSQSQIDIIKNKVLPNGLIDDLNFYVSLSNGVNYAVCILKGPISKHYLYLEDMLILQSNKWITSDLIVGVSFMLQIAYPHTNSVVFHDNVSTNVLEKGKNLDRDHFALQNSIITENTTKLFFPVNISGVHWVLVYANVKEKTFSYIDPMDDTENVTLGLKTVEKRTFDRFIKFFAHLTEQNVDNVNKGWRFVQYTHPVQHDGYSCGAFVMYFIEQLMTNDSISVQSFSPNRYRAYLYKKLLLHSESMINICLQCKMEFTSIIPHDKESESVECTACSRWYHILRPGCLPDDVPKDSNILNKSDVRVFCALCRQYWKTYLQK
ncbi:LOW QUALITY PROTEIN: uncharacterized protein LOC124368040 [Homalodisca vitripennis]|uniref:LOW QUALITY PROTEIN: uncharacterized protein LOC124368040 n=1 Tax=Homalodisca vitripennis TaxID=197043 RepID=UPI001EECBEC2|nr:LOW QUALITY PROTEIN: uncharacterized protein LOC124368040 [Homalodisca vitripennis]